MQVPQNHDLRFSLLRPPTPDEFNELSNSNTRSGLIRNRAETMQWGVSYLGIVGLTQYLYSRHLKKQELPRSARQMRFAGFLILNVMQSILITNVVIMTPI